ncbi:MAG: ComEC/Rec2 family competence protein [Chitinophagaceae bacterium]|nr:ComEC/Rec2 family competence protein [Chitinophagaceae bacterium]
MLLTIAPVWKEAPFIRLLIPLMAGIIFQWYYPVSVSTLIIACLACCIFFFIFSFLKGYALFRHKWLLGVLLTGIFIITGALLVHFKNITHQQKWFGNIYNDSTTVIAVLNEPLVEKDKSYKAVATVLAVVDEEKIINTKGDIILYFKKDSATISGLQYGSAIIFNKPLQAITNSGNPGAFDYKRYCLFQDITHQVFLGEKDFKTADGNFQPVYKRWLQNSKIHLLQILRKYIPGEREAGVAKALLIGYRDDLDRDLVQSYSNTGVIHVIAISGMHLAMIYGLLIIILKPLSKNRKTRLVRGIVILSVLWLFTLLSGAGPSILRSAVMFSFIVIGESLSKQVSIYHTLSASAFFLLCYNPFFVWDVGFQLSYTAVLSIVIFSTPVSNWVYFKNKWIDNVWKLMAVTISAQILTTPLSVYHFHQVPNLFLLSNLVIVPLSGIVLYAEILLCIISFIAPLAALTGKLVSVLIQWMNSFINWVDSIPFAVSNNISISIIQACLLYAFIITFSLWLMHKRNAMVKYAVAALLMFSISVLLKNIYQQQKQTVIVYNTPKYRAMDCISGKQYFFIGDDTCRENGFFRNFHLNPSRILHNVKEADSLAGLWSNPPYIFFKNKTIALLDSTVKILPDSGAVNVDIVILSQNIKYPVSLISQAFRSNQYVFDGSNSAWKIRQWKNECDSLHLRRHSVQDDGAFVLDF